MIHPLIGVLQALMATGWSRLTHLPRKTEAGRADDVRLRHSSQIGPLIESNSEDFNLAARKVSAILQELSVRRERFRSTGDLLELYPTFAFNMVAEDLNYITRLESPDRAMLLDVVVTFYDAHESNRRAFFEQGIRSVESHWRRYFKRAIALNKRKFVSQGDVLLLILDGTAAHLADLPRALTHVARTYGKPIEPIKAEYDAIDPLISKSVRWSIGDIRTALQKTNTRLIEKTMTIGANYVIHERRLAWRIATKGLPVPTREPQPVLTRRYTDPGEFQPLIQLLDLRTQAI